MKKLIVSIILATACTTTSYAETDLLQVVQQALTFDQTFQSAKATYLAATEAYPQALALLYPNVGLTGYVSTAHNKTMEGFLGTPSESGNLKGYQYTLTVTQPVINFNNWWGVCQANYQVKAAAATYAAAAQDLLLRTAQAYFNVLQAQDIVRFTQAELLANKQQLDQARQRFQVGLDAITSVYNAEASYDANVAQLISAKNDVQNRREQLREITGVYYNNLATLKKSMPLLTPKPINVETWIDKSDQFNFQLQAARFTAEAARQAIKIAFSGHLPTVNLVGTSQRMRIGNPVEGIAGSTDTRNNTLALQLDMPIFQGGLVNSQVRQQEYNYQKAIADMENTHQQVMVNLRQTYNSIIAGISKVKADQQAVLSQQASVDSTDASVKVGTRTIFELLQAQQQLFQAQTTLSQDQYLYINNTLQFKQLAGTLTYKDLQAINTWLKNQGATKSPYNSLINNNDLLVTHKTAMPINNITGIHSLIASIPNSFNHNLTEKPTQKKSTKVTKHAIKAKQTQPITNITTFNPNEKTYSLQLMARQNKTAITNFVSQNHLANKTTIHQTHVNGKSWYVLLYGNYNSTSAAQSAMTTLPNKLQKMNPWVRPMP